MACGHLLSDTSQLTDPSFGTKMCAVNDTRRIRITNDILSFVTGTLQCYFCS